jgi:transposase
MKKDQSAEGIKSIRTLTILYLGLELSNTKWKLAFSNGAKSRFVTIDARDLKRFYREVDEGRKRFGLASNVKILSYFEAGRDGFWIHRFLIDGGIENIVVDSANIEVNRRQRRAKTDRLDAGKLVNINENTLYINEGSGSFSKQLLHG